MRFLRLTAIVVLILSIVYALWANNRYYSGVNTDHPKIVNTVEQLQISVEDPPEALLQGLSAWDATDGDLTANIMVASVSHFIAPGMVNVKYVVFDSYNNSATLTRRVQYTDYVAPAFSMDKTPVYVVGTTCDLLEHIQVTDCLDGDISDRVRVISNMVNNFSAGNYPVVLEVSNSCGDTAQMTVWVTYQNAENTAVINLHQYVKYVPQGETFDPRGLITSVTNQNGEPLDQSQVEVMGNVDLDTPGSYQLIFKYNDGTLTGQSTLAVIVTER
ncbi:MAG: bacterial Ig-like domain-containing protein [Oscillospiraceae bacterium]|nr:bacterial Ig-like domain-containing protein [Oscillospiraceae bacterium]